MSVDPQRSILVASALLERFRALLDRKPLSTEPEAELEIGEAQQMYPEIWRHLDEARSELEARGRDVSSYDRVRKHELAQLGVTDVETLTGPDYMSLLGGLPGTITFKTVRFNVDGYRRAIEAKQALMDLMPEVDWRQIARDDAHAIQAAGSLSSRKWNQILLWSALGLGLVGVLVGVSRMIDRDAAPRTDPDPLAERRLDPAEQAERARHRAARLPVMRALYEQTCDPVARVELLELLRDDAPDQARAIESATCVPARPSCDLEDRAAIAERMATRLQLPRGKLPEVACEGILVADGGGTTELALAFLVTGAAKAGTTIGFRGVTTPDGTRELVAFDLSPGTRLVGAGDLDRQLGDELVFVDDQEVTVSAVRGGQLVDIVGPSLRATCATEVTLEVDRRAGRAGNTKAIVLSVPTGATGESCLPPGRHHFIVESGRVVDSRY